MGSMKVDFGRIRFYFPKRSPRPMDGFIKRKPHVRFGHARGWLRVSRFIPPRKEIAPTVPQTFFQKIISFARGQK